MECGSVHNCPWAVGTTFFPSAFTLHEKAAWNSSVKLTINTSISKEDISLFSRMVTRDAKGSMARIHFMLGVSFKSIMIKEINCLNIVLFGLSIAECIGLIDE